MRVPLPLMVVATVVALPVLIPYAIGRYYLDRHRLRAAARRIACPACGCPLGVEAVREADECWRSHVKWLCREHPGIRFRLVRMVQAICVHCGARLSFHEDSGSFTETKAVA